ncbi:hypothetical protein PG993_007876 [Apiospora rasikravindrae]|uniref:FAD dependent oxidoreductase domain-containing protein n=1 Tax=Apiospora rasikravindrae TaxID=990691 RepID=A0ABR1SYR3_9PEZI
MTSIKPLEKNSSILIIGAGTWGTSIAYRLVKRGYTNIKVLDSNTFPSSISAGNDHNKILEEPTSPPADNQTDLDYAWNTIETLSSEVWRNDPVYAPHYHPTGFIYAAVGDDAWAKVKAAAEARPDVYAPLEGADAFRQTMPEGVLTGDLTGWRGFIRREGAGWVEARDVLLDVHAEAAKGGANFVCDPKAGRVAELLYEGDEVVGAKTADGETHHADFTILAAGAGASTLVDFENQLRPTAWTLGHVSLTAAEAPAYAELPVLFAVDEGFFLSPPKSAIAAGNPELKICDEHPGYIHLVEEDGKKEKQPVPVPRDAIPRTSATNMQKLLQATVSQVADRPLLRPRLCWDADTPDRLFLIAKYPRGSSQRLLVAAGGSGNGFMNSPAVGILVADLLEDQLDERMAKSLRWRPETAVDRDWFDTQGRFGGSGKVVDLGEIPDSDWVEGSAS